jgi:H+-transporting ATPase
MGSQAVLYPIRGRRHLWGSRPSLWLVISSVTDILIAYVLSLCGFAITALPAVPVVGTLIAATAPAFLLDAVKLPVFSRLMIV